MNNKKSLEIGKVNEKKVAIIICTYNQNILLRKCLSSLKNKTDYKKYKVYFIDDSGKREIGKEIKTKFSWVNVLINKKNLGFSKSNNIGIKKALKDFNPDYFLLLNDDVEIVEKNWLKKLIQAGEEDEKSGILGCRIVYPDGSLQWVAKNNKILSFKKPGNKEFSKKMLETQKVNDIMGACFLVKKEVINEIGLFDEKFSPFYGEETDFCYRAINKGFNLIYVGNTKLIHYGAASTGRLKDSKIWYIKKRNAIRLEWLNFNFLKIIRYSLIHFGSVFFKKEDKKISLEKNILKKFCLLCKAYLANILNLNEILQKRKKR